MRHITRALILPLLFLAAFPALAWAQQSPTLNHVNDLIEWGRWKEARDLMWEALRAHPNDAQLLAQQAHILTAFGNVDQALSLARRAVAADGNCALCHLYLSEAKGEQVRRMSKFRALLNLPRIRRELKLADQLNPGLANVHWGLINYNLEVPAAAGGDINKARQQAAQLAKIDPVDGHIAEASIDIATGHNTSAFREYQQAAHDYPKDPRGLFYTGMTLFQQAQFSAALPYLQQAWKLQDQSALYAAYLSADLVHLKQQAQAYRIVQQAQKNFPNSRLPDYLTAKALKDVGQNFDWARQLLQDYLAVPAEPDQPSWDEARKLLSALR